MSRSNYYFLIVDHKNTENRKMQLRNEVLSTNNDRCKRTNELVKHVEKVLKLNYVQNLSNKMRRRVLVLVIFQLT
jgi:hypothetical protein